MKIFIVLLLLTASSVQATPVVDTETEYYVVDGKDARAIRADMNAKREGRYDAYTAWHVKWRFFWDKQPNICTIMRVKSTVSVKFTLPKLAEHTIANQDAKNRWNRYYHALIDHENGHRDFGVNAAKEIEAALLDMNSYKNCTTLEKAANALAHKIVNEYIVDEKQYDIDTNHGLNNGAFFP